ncbi:lipopolysaccharide heptosyltransferase II [Rhodoferax sp. TH121]|nr:lipopolysaccharide heptosyltransferase II [Rhodoferax sp. TH121]
MTEPLMRRLQARGERLTVGALPWVAPVYRAMPQVAEVIEFPFAHGGLQWAGRRAMAKALRGRFDAAYVCPNSLKSALIPWWAGVPRRVGYSGESRWGLINPRLPNPPEGERPPMVAFYSALSGETGLDADRPQLQLTPGAADQALAAQGLSAHGFYVMAPGAEYGPAKRWPAAHFATLASQLALPVLLLGSGKDAAVCAEIASAVNASQPGQCVDLAGKTSLDQAIALIASSKAMVSNDSGLMHVAAAFGVPQVAVFGSSSPLHTPPLSDRATVLWLKNDPSYQPPLDCAPCFARDCPLGHTRCLNDITPARVLSAL